VEIKTLSGMVVRTRLAASIQPSRCPFSFY
jgi:hypothetical protein